MKETVVKISKTKSCLFEKINKIDKTLGRLMKKKRRINKIRKETGEVTTGQQTMQRNTKHYKRLL